MADPALRDLLDGDLGALQSLIERCADYYEVATGAPPGPAEAQSIFNVVPEGKGHEDKFLLSVSTEGELTGVVDLIRDWPERGTWIIGLLLLAPEARGHGLGGRVVAELERRARAGGAERMRVAVSPANRPALGFWHHLGYERLPPEGRDEDLVRMFKPLASPAITVYSKPDCHLCVDAMAILEGMREEFGFELREVDITSDDQLHRAYFERIPVVLLDGEELSEYFVDESALRERLESRR